MFVQKKIHCLLSHSISHLMTPEIYLVTLWRGLAPKSGTTVLNYVNNVDQTS